MSQHTFEAIRKPRTDERPLWSEIVVISHLLSVIKGVSETNELSVISYTRSTPNELG
jgi:hypothetical protein